MEWWNLTIGVWLSNTFTIKFHICLVYIKHAWFFFFGYSLPTLQRMHACIHSTFSSPLQCIGGKQPTTCCVFMCTGQTRNFILHPWVLELNPGPLHGLNCQYSTYTCQWLPMVSARSVVRAKWRALGLIWFQWLLASTFSHNNSWG